MKGKLVPFLVLVLLCAGYLIFVAGSASRLPEQVAMHFNAGGQADNWMNRSHTVAFWETLGVILPVFFMVSALLTGLIPARFVNLPHREHWLAPERKTQTVAYISRQMIWMGCLAILFLAGIYYLTIQANRLTPAHLPMGLFLAMTTGFLAGVIIWSMAFVRHFTKVP